MSSPVTSCVEHYAIAVADPQASADWYCRVLDFKVAFSNQKNPPTLLIDLPSGARLEIMPKNAGVEQRPRHNLDPGFSHIAFGVKRLDAAVATLRERGVEIGGDPFPAVGGGFILNFRDLDGNSLQLVERPAK